MGRDVIIVLIIILSYQIMMYTRIVEGLDTEEGFGTYFSGFFNMFSDSGDAEKLRPKQCYINRDESDGKVPCSHLYAGENVCRLKPNYCMELNFGVGGKKKIDSFLKQYLQNTPLLITIRASPTFFHDYAVNTERMPLTDPKTIKSITDLTLQTINDILKYMDVTKGNYFAASTATSTPLKSKVGSPTSLSVLIDQIYISDIGGTRGDKINDYYMILENVLYLYYYMVQSQNSLQDPSQNEAVTYCQSNTVGNMDVDHTGVVYTDLDTDQCSYTDCSDSPCENTQGWSVCKPGYKLINDRCVPVARDEHSKLFTKPTSDRAKPIMRSDWTNESSLNISDVIPPQKCFMAQDYIVGPGELDVHGTGTGIGTGIGTGTGDGTINTQPKRKESLGQRKDATYVNIHGTVPYEGDSITFGYSTCVSCFDKNIFGSISGTHMNTESGAPSFDASGSDASKDGELCGLSGSWQGAHVKCDTKKKRVDCEDEDAVGGRSCEWVEYNSGETGTDNGKCVPRCPRKYYSDNEGICVDTPMGHMPVHKSQKYTQCEKKDSTQCDRSNQVDETCKWQAKIEKCLPTAEDPLDGDDPIQIINENIISIYNYILGSDTAALDTLHANFPTLQYDNNNTPIFTDTVPCWFLGKWYDESIETCSDCPKGTIFKLNDNDEPPGGSCVNQLTCDYYQNTVPIPVADDSTVDVGVEDFLGRIFPKHGIPSVCECTDTSKSTDGNTHTDTWFKPNCAEHLIDTMDEACILKTEEAECLLAPTRCNWMAMDGVCGISESNKRPDLELTAKDIGYEYYNSEKEDDVTLAQYISEFNIYNTTSDRAAPDWLPIKNQTDLCNYNGSYGTCQTCFDDITNTEYKRTDNGKECNEWCDRDETTTSSVTTDTAQVAPSKTLTDKCSAWGKDSRREDNLARYWPSVRVHTDPSLRLGRGLTVDNVTINITITWEQPVHPVVSSNYGESHPSLGENNDASDAWGPAPVGAAFAKWDNLRRELYNVLPLYIRRFNLHPPRDLVTSGGMPGILGFDEQDPVKNIIHFNRGGFRKTADGVGISSYFHEEDTPLNKRDLEDSFNRGKYLDTDLPFQQSNEERARATPLYLSSTTRLDQPWVDVGIYGRDETTVDTNPDRAQSNQGLRGGQGIVWISTNFPENENDWLGEFDDNGEYGGYHYHIDDSQRDFPRENRSKDGGVGGTGDPFAVGTGTKGMDPLTRFDASGVPKIIYDWQAIKDQCLLEFIYGPSMTEMIRSQTDVTLFTETDSQGPYDIAGSDDAAAAANSWRPPVSSASPNALLLQLLPTGASTLAAMGRDAFTASLDQGSSVEAIESRNDARTSAAITRSNATAAVLAKIEWRNSRIKQVTPSWTGDEFLMISPYLEHPLGTLIRILPNNITHRDILGVLFSAFTVMEWCKNGRVPAPFLTDDGQHGQTPMIFRPTGDADDPVNLGHLYPKGDKDIMIGLSWRRSDVEKHISDAQQIPIDGQNISDIIKINEVSIRYNISVYQYMINQGTDNHPVFNTHTPGTAPAGTQEDVLQGPIWWGGQHPPSTKGVDISMIQGGGATIVKEDHREVVRPGGTTTSGTDLGTVPLQSWLSDSIIYPSLWDGTVVANGSRSFELWDIDPRVGVPTDDPAPFHGPFVDDVVYLMRMFQQGVFATLSGSGGDELGSDWQKQAYDQEAPVQALIINSNVTTNWKDYLTPNDPILMSELTDINATTLTKNLDATDTAHKDVISILRDIPNFLIDLVSDVMSVGLNAEVSVSHTSNTDMPTNLKLADIESWRQFDTSSERWRSEANEVYNLSELATKYPSDLLKDYRSESDVASRFRPLRYPVPEKGTDASLYNRKKAQLDKMIEICNEPEDPEPDPSFLNNSNQIDPLRNNEKLHDFISGHDNNTIFSADITDIQCEILGSVIDTSSYCSIIDPNCLSEGPLPLGDTCGFQSSPLNPGYSSYFTDALPTVQLYSQTAKTTYSWAWWTADPPTVTKLFADFYAFMDQTDQIDPTDMTDVDEFCSTRCAMPVAPGADDAPGAVDPALVANPGSPPSQWITNQNDNKQTMQSPLTPDDQSLVLSRDIFTNIHAYDNGCTRESADSCSVNNTKTTNFTTSESLPLTEITSTLPEDSYLCNRLCSVDEVCGATSTPGTMSPTGPTSNLPSIISITNTSHMVDHCPPFSSPNSEGKCRYADGDGNPHDKSGSVINVEPGALVPTDCPADPLKPAQVFDKNVILFDACEKWYDEPSTVEPSMNNLQQCTSDLAPSNLNIELLPARGDCTATDPANPDDVVTCPILTPADTDLMIKNYNTIDSAFSGLVPDSCIMPRQPDDTFPTCVNFVTDRIVKEKYDSLYDDQNIDNKRDSYLDIFNINTRLVNTPSDSDVQGAPGSVVPGPGNNPPFNSNHNISPPSPLDPDLTQKYQPKIFFGEYEFARYVDKNLNDAQNPSPPGLPDNWETEIDAYKNEVKVLGDPTAWRKCPWKLASG